MLPAAGIDSSQQFTQALSYALTKLGSPEMSLKKEQRLAIQAVYGGRDVFVWLPTVCASRHSHLYLTTS